MPSDRHRPVRATYPPKPLRAFTIRFECRRHLDPARSEPAPSPNRPTPFPPTWSVLSLGTTVGNAPSTAPRRRSTHPRLLQAPRRLRRPRASRPTSSGQIRASPPREATDRTRSGRSGLPEPPPMPLPSRRHRRRVQHFPTGRSTSVLSFPSAIAWRLSLRRPNHAQHASAGRLRLPACRVSSGRTGPSPPSATLQAIPSSQSTASSLSLVATPPPHSTTPPPPLAAVRQPISPSTPAASHKSPLLIANPKA